MNSLISHQNNPWYKDEPAKEAEDWPKVAG